MRPGGLILAAGSVRSKNKKKHEITGNSLIIVAHTKNKIKYINNSTPFPGVFDAGGC